MQEIITSSVEQSPFEQTPKYQSDSAKCCQGAVVEKNKACCKLDEDKKAAGEDGCGCNTKGKNTFTAGCC